MRYISDDHLSEYEERSVEEGMKEIQRGEYVDFDEWVKANN
ncbi:hypothetical protein [Natranaerobius trueperi]|nr:hypothetical protein [Natranaerobius trueperi]